MKKSSYAFIVHSRDRTDLPRKFPVTRFLPKFIFDFITFYLRPIIVSNISGLKDKDNNEINGIIIGVPMTARQLLENKSSGVRRIIQAVKLAKSKGARYVGLGAMTTSITRGGKDVIDSIDNIYVTTGRTYTAGNIINYIDYCIKRFNLDKSKIKIGIVGAAGGIGSGVAIGLANKNYKNFTLIDLERKLLNLQKKIEIIENYSKELNIDISHKVSVIGSCDIVIAATSSPEIVIKSEDVNPGTIIINDAQPSDISPDIIAKRPDVLIIEGGVLHTPNFNCHFNFGLAHKSDIYSCLAETILLTSLRVSNHHSLDDFDVSLYSKLKIESDSLGFDLCLQNDAGIIDNDKLEYFSNIISQKTLR